MYFKLGDGPINYEWNRRYFSIEATDLIYSQTETFEDKKSINIQGAAVSQIAEIKSHKYAFCVILPPPIYKLVYISADKAENAESLREKIIKATMNNIEEGAQNLLGKQLDNGSDRAFNFNHKKQHEDNANNALYSGNDAVPEELGVTLEEFKENVLKSDKNNRIIYQNGIRMSIPLDKDKEMNEMHLAYDLLWVIMIMMSITISLCYLMKLFIGGVVYYTFIVVLLIGVIYKKLLIYSKISFPSSDQPCNYFVKASTIVDCNMKKVFDVISNMKTRKEWDYFMQYPNSKGNNNESNLPRGIPHKIEFLLSPDFTNHPLLCPIITLYAYIKGLKESNLFIYLISQMSFYDAKKNYFIFFYETLHPLDFYLRNNKGFLEGYCLSSVDVNKTMIIFFTNIDFNKATSIINHSAELQLPYYLRQILKHERLQTLSLLKEHLKQYCNSNDKNIEGIRPIVKEENHLEVMVNKKYEQYAQLLNRQYPINPRSFLIEKSGMSIEDRFPGYLRYSEGGIECRNYVELRNYDGLMLDLMKRAGKMLLEGKNIIGISLPSKIFEPKSTLVRLVELWGTGPIYLNIAAKMCNGNSIEMMKNIIAFVVSGLHMNIKQLKPYNPIVGETYQGFWPDGSKIYLEHISHHPGLSRFLVVSPDNLWRFQGYYEYVACIKGIGNVASGQFKGINTIDFPQLNKQIEFHFPFQSISGMMYGKRVIEWEGDIKFVNPKDGIECTLTFTKQRGFLQQFIEPTDTIRGFIKEKDQIVSKVFGSPLDSLFFDGKLFWSLEKCDLFLPVNTERCIPSDCRYRPDCIALGNGDVELADIEKVKLEVIQRNDKALRLKANKN